MGRQGVTPYCDGGVVIASCVVMASCFDGKFCCDGDAVMTSFVVAAKLC